MSCLSFPVETGRTGRLLSAYSSVVEPPAHNRLVLGSIPSGRIGERMKIGTLIQDTTRDRKKIDRFGVVVATNGREMTVHWSKGHRQEEISIVDFNKWVVAGFFRVMGPF